MIKLLMISMLFSCSDTSKSETPTAPSQTEQTQNTLVQEHTTHPIQPVFEDKNNLDQGQKHPPLPADNPAWNWDAQGFVPDFGWYGEHNWNDVRMRVVGHLAMGFRDLARLHLLNQDWEKAISTHQQSIEVLSQIDTRPSKFAEEIQTILVESFKRDHQILLALQGNGPFPTTSPDTLIHWRIEVWKLQQKSNLDLVEIENMQSALKQRFAEPTVSNIDDFENFVDRHKLRTELFQAYVDSLDPLLPSDHRWGYWRPTEIQRQAGALWLTLEDMKSASTPDVHKVFTPVDWSSSYTYRSQHPFTQELSTLKASSNFFSSSYFGWLLTDQSPDFSPEQFGRLPTGDSIIDVGGQPGPMGIGTLMKLDLSDSEHFNWLSNYGTQIQQATPSQAVDLCMQAISELNAYSHGSRFYNVKQFRNACTRQLARLGHYKEAKTVFSSSFPLHHQDWACPNREGLLLVIMGRLTALSESTNAGIDILERSIQSGKDFLLQVELAERGEISEPKPPMMKLKGPPPNGSRPPTNARKPSIPQQQNVQR